MASAAELIASLFDELPHLDANGVAAFFEEGVKWESDVLPDGSGDLSLIRAFHQQVREGFPNFVTRVTRTFSESESEAAFEFTFTGDNMGYLPNAGVTRRSAELTGRGYVAVKGERISSLSTTWNCARLMAQLGIRAHMRADPPHPPLVKR